jgi:hypothetical protein
MEDESEERTSRATEAGCSGIGFLSFRSDSEKAKKKKKRATATEGRAPHNSKNEKKPFDERGESLLLLLPRRLREDSFLLSLSLKLLSCSSSPASCREERAGTKSKSEYSLLILFESDG